MPTESSARLSEQLNAPLNILRLPISTHLKPEEFLYRMFSDIRAITEQAIEVQALLISNANAENLFGKIEGYAPNSNEDHVLFLEYSKSREPTRIYVPISSTPNPDYLGLSELNLISTLMENEEGISLDPAKPTNTEAIRRLYNSLLGKLNALYSSNSELTDEIDDQQGLQATSNETLGQEGGVLRFPIIHKKGIDPFKEKPQEQKFTSIDFPARAQSLVRVYREVYLDQKEMLRRYSVITGKIDGIIEVSLPPPELNRIINERAPKPEDVISKYLSKNTWHVYFRSLGNQEKEEIMIDITELEKEIITIFAQKGTRELSLDELKNVLYQSHKVRIESGNLLDSIARIADRIKNSYGAVFDEHNIAIRKNRKILRVRLPLPAFKGLTE